MEIAVYEENETKFISITSDLENRLNEQREKFDQVGNPDYDAMTKLEESMKNKFVQVEKTLKESLVKEVHGRSKQLEEKHDKVGKENRSYAEIARNIQSSGETHCGPTVNTEFRSIMK